MAERIVAPKPHVQQKARVRSWDDYKALYDESLADREGFWDRQSELVDFFAPFSRTLRQDFEKGEVAWFCDGKLNVAYN